MLISKGPLLNNIMMCSYLGLYCDWSYKRSTRNSVDSFNSYFPNSSFKYINCSPHQTRPKSTSRCNGWRLPPSLSLFARLIRQRTRIATGPPFALNLQNIIAKTLLERKKKSVEDYRGSQMKGSRQGHKGSERRPWWQAHRQQVPGQRVPWGSTGRHWETVALSADSHDD